MMANEPNKEDTFNYVIELTSRHQIFVIVL